MLSQCALCATCQKLLRSKNIDHSKAEIKKGGGPPEEGRGGEGDVHQLRREDHGRNLALTGTIVKGSVYENTEVNSNAVQLHLPPSPSPPLPPPPPSLLPLFSPKTPNLSRSCIKTSSGKRTGNNKGFLYRKTWSLQVDLRAQTSWQRSAYVPPLSSTADGLALVAPMGHPGQS